MLHSSLPGRPSGEGAFDVRTPAEHARIVECPPEAVLDIKFPPEGARDVDCPPEEVRIIEFPPEAARIIGDLESEGPEFGTADVGT